MAHSATYERADLRLRPPPQAGRSPSPPSRLCGRKPGHWVPRMAGAAIQGTGRIRYIHNAPPGCQNSPSAPRCLCPIGRPATSAGTSTAHLRQSALRESGTLGQRFADQEYGRQVRQGSSNSRRDARHGQVDRKAGSSNSQGQAIAARNCRRTRRNHNDYFRYSVPQIVEMAGLTRFVEPRL